MPAEGSKSQWTVGEARDWLRARSLKGVKCPCCQQDVKVYRRKLYSSLARALIFMYRNRDADNCFRITSAIETKNGDTAKLRHWGLIGPDPQGRAGTWQITPKGEAFARGRVRVLSHVEIYNKQLLDVNGDEITIRDALGRKFDYDELMGTDGTALPDLEGDDE